MRFIEFVYFIWLIVVIFCSVESKRKFGMWTNHYAITNFFWAFYLYVSLFQNNYVRPVSSEVYLIFFTGSLFFNLTLFTSNIKRFNSNCESGVYSLKKRRIVELLVLAVIVPMAYSNLQLILSGEPLWKLYADYWENTKHGNYAFELFRQALILPLGTILMSTCFFTKYYDSKKYSKYITIFIGLAYSILTMLMSAGGRKGIMQFVYIIVLSWLAGHYLKKYDLAVKIKTSYMVILIGLLTVGLIFASQGRGDDAEGAIVEAGLGRFALYPALFEGWYKLTDVCQGYTLGYSMFEMPLVIITYPFRLLGIDFFSVERVSVLEQMPQYAPALGTSSNAYVSAFFYYMRDFGIFGVAIGPLIVGNIYNFLWRLCRNDSFLLYFYITGIGLTCTELDYPFLRGNIFIIIIVFMYRRFVSAPRNVNKQNKYSNI